MGKNTLLSIISFVVAIAAFTATIACIMVYFKRKNIHCRVISNILKRKNVPEKEEFINVDIAARDSGEDL